MVQSEPPDVFWENLAVAETTIHRNEWTAGVETMTSPLRCASDVSSVGPLEPFRFRVQGLGFRVQGLGFRVQLLNP